MKLIPWSQRRLEFNKGVEDLPFLLERMAGTPARVAALFRELSMESMTLRVHDDLSVLDRVAQMLYLDIRFQDRVDDLLARRPRLCEIAFADEGTLRAAQRDRDIGDMLEEFRLRRSSLVHRFNALDTSTISFKAMHPCQKRPMGVVDMALWIAEHDDHILAESRQMGGRA